MYKAPALFLGLCLSLLLASCSYYSSPQFFASGQSSDTSLTTSVRTAFIESGEPMLEAVHIQTIEGRVILSGYVKKIRQSDNAELIASRVPGVREVVNNIIVRQ